MKTENSCDNLANSANNTTEENGSAQYSYENMTFETEEDTATTDLEKRSNDCKICAKEILNDTEPEIRPDAAVLQINDHHETRQSQYKTEIQRKNSKMLTFDIELTRQFVTKLEWSPSDRISVEKTAEVETHTAATGAVNIPKEYPPAYKKENGPDIVSTDSVVINGEMISVSYDSEAVKQKDIAKTVTDQNNTRSTKGKLRRLCEDKALRNKAIRTFFVLWNFTIFGWSFGINGPTLPDLQLITGASLQQASWLFTGFNIGYLISCATSGFVQRLVNSDALVFLYTIGLAASMGVLPWLPSIYPMIAARGAIGYSCGGLDIELHSMIFAIWQSEGGVFLQMTHFLFAVGGILSPLVSKPFMIRTIQALEENVTTLPSSGFNNTTSQDAYGCLPLIDTETKGENFSTTAECAGDATVSKETNIQIAFLIGAILAVLAALPFLVFYIKGRNKAHEKNTKHEENESSSKLPGKVQILVVILLCVVSAVATALVDMFPSYLATFGLLQLGWSQDFASSMTALFFAMYAVGNLLGVFILKCITSRSFIYIAYFTSIGSIFLFLVSVLWTITAVQTFVIAAIGMTVSAILPTLFTWTQEAVTPISGKIASAFLFAGSAGGMANPVLLGFLMESLSPMWFLYLSLAEVLFCFVLFTAAVIVVKTFLRRQRRATLYEIQIRKSNSVVGFTSEDKERPYESEYYNKRTLAYI